MTNNKYSKFKIVWFPEKIESLKQGKTNPPIYVRIKPTNKCNHNCFFCCYNLKYCDMHNTTRRIDEIPKKKMMEILKDLKKMNVKAVTYSGGGDPLVYPYIDEILKRTLDYGIKLSIITNGQLLMGKKAKLLAKAKWVRISADYYNAKSFSKNRRIPEKNFKKLIQNIINFNKIRNKNCDFEINFVVHESNYKHIYDAAKLFKNLGVDNIRFSPVWKDNFYKYHTKIRSQVKKQLDLARKNLESKEFKIYDSYEIISEPTKRTYKKCQMMQILPVIGADCKIYTCHNKAYDKQGIIGDIKDKSFKEVWFSEKTKRFFKKFNPIKYCNKHQCTNDKKNIIINEILDVEGDYFI